MSCATIERKKWFACCAFNQQGQKAINFIVYKQFTYIKLFKYCTRSDLRRKFRFQIRAKLEHPKAGTPFKN